MLVIGEAKNSLEMNRRTLFADSLVPLSQLA
jgi:hypothetical protein